MNDLNRTYLESIITNISICRGKIQWLLDHEVTPQKIFNPGCKYGFETLALMWTFQSTEAFGIDINESYIIEASQLHSEMMEEINRIYRMLHYYQMTEAEREWWESIHEFFKIEIFNDIFKLEFEAGDIAHVANLRTDYFDLAFCRRVLHHILYDQKRESPLEDAQSAISEMARSVKPGGMVAASAVIQFDDTPKLDFGELFKRAGLFLIYRREIEATNITSSALTEDYLYKKPK